VKGTLGTQETELSHRVWGRGIPRRFGERDGRLKTGRQRTGEEISVVRVACKKGHVIRENRNIPDQCGRKHSSPQLISSKWGRKIKNRSSQGDTANFIPREWTGARYRQIAQI